ncbi:MAG: hypothetical protein QOH63_1543 [Acidobacteriota bacterium]|jgi:hypothetical protein|nr:hypothetical protein [Acidobacteriota bacterium]
MVKIEKKLWPWAMFAGLLALYLLLPTKNYFWDGVDFAQSIEDATRLNASLIHPNHLFYNPFGYLIYRTLQAIGLNFRAIEVLQITNSVLSVLSAYLFFHILRATLRSRYLCYALTLLFALSATWWKYSTDADSYIPSVLFIIVAAYFLMPDRKARPVSVALAHMASMLFHQMAVFFFPVCLVGIFLQTCTLDMKRRIVLLLQYAATASILTLLTFYYSFYLQTGRADFHSLFKWMTSLSPEPGHTFSVWGNFVYTVNGHVKLFTSGRTLYLRGALTPLNITLLSILLIIVVLLLLKLARHFGELKSFLTTPRRKDERLKSLRILCAVWIASFLIFQYFFVPQHTFYRLFYLPAIILLVGTYLMQYEATPAHRRRYRVALLVAAIAVSNLTFYILPLAQVRNYPPLAVALKMNQAWPKGTIVFFASRNSDNSLVRYFNPSAVWIEAKPETMESEMQGLQAGRDSLWMETSLLDLYQATPEGKRWLDAHTIQRPEDEFIDDKYRLQFYQIKLMNDER